MSEIGDHLLLRGIKPYVGTRIEFNYEQIRKRYFELFPEAQIVNNTDFFTVCASFAKFETSLTFT